MPPTTPEMPTRTQARSWRKRIVRLLIVALLALVVLLYFGSIGLYVYISTQDARGEVCCNTPADWSAEDYESVTIPGADGVTLAGWYVPPDPDAPVPANQSAIILLHGYGGNRLTMGPHAIYLNDAGYGVLMVDLRAHGESSGEYRSFGWQDVDDIPALVAFLEQRPEVQHIGILGHSIGAQIAARAGADIPAIEAFVLDGPSPATGRDVRPLIDDHAIFAFWYATYSLIDQGVALGLNIPVPESAVEALARLESRPVLVIAGAKERPEPDYGKAYREALDDNGELWLVKDAGHGETWHVAEDYGARVIAFYEAAFAG